MIQIDIQMPEGCQTCPFCLGGGQVYCLAQSDMTGYANLHVIDDGGRGSWISPQWKEATCPLKDVEGIKINSEV